MVTLPEQNLDQEAQERDEGARLETWYLGNSLQEGTGKSVGKQGEL